VKTAPLNERPESRSDRQGHPLLAIISSGCSFKEVGLAHPNRKALSQKTRFEIFKRDEFMCQYCGSTPPAVVLEVDHILAVANGGENNCDNLITSCFDCNRGKAATPLTSVPETLAEKAARVKESEKQLKAYYKILQSKKDRLYSESWQIAEILLPGCGETGFNICYRKSIENFLQRLDYYEVEDSAHTAVFRFPSYTVKTFKYFCGICWRKIRGNQYGEG